MIRIGILALAGLLAAASASAAASGRVIKVLPHYLDLKGLHTLSPSLYERDAYQAFLRLHPEQRSTLRFDVQWKAKTEVGAGLKLRIELRGIAQGNTPKELVLETPVGPGGFFSHWASLKLTPEQYKQCGEVTAWRATLWDHDELLGEQKSFLW